MSRLIDADDLLNISKYGILEIALVLTRKNLSIVLTIS